MSDSELPTKPSPSALHEQTGGGAAYIVAMLEHGYVIPTSLEAQRANPLRKESGKRAEPCGLTHEPQWSGYRGYQDEFGPYEARWCQVCARVDAKARP